MSNASPSRRYVCATRSGIGNLSALRSHEFRSVCDAIRARFTLYTLLLAALAPRAEAAVSVWTGASSTDWATAGNWSGVLPGANDDVLIDGGAKHPLLNLTNGTVTIKSLTIGPTTASTLTFHYGNVTDKRLIVTGSATIGTNGILNHTANGNTETHRLFLDVGGNLTIDLGGAISVNGLGYAAGQGTGTGDGASHGGQGGGLQSTYGSLTNPVSCGSGSSGIGGSGGGAVLLTIGGTLTANGVIEANGIVGSYNGAHGGSGGSINIVAAGLSGNGTLSAGGANGYKNGAGGGGGRIAIMLRGDDDTAFSSFLANNRIAAKGGSLGDWVWDQQSGAAGTVYLKSTSATYGRLIVNNSNIATTARTLINSLVTDKTVGDVQLVNAGYLVVDPGQTLAVNGSWSNAVATNAISGGTVVLAGSSPATIWGGNTWSNLTITTAGKLVQFQTNVIQYVYGTPAWSNNVQLLPIQYGYVDGTYWKLYQPSWGATQDVGVVTVRWSDALVNTGATFRAAIGASVSNSRNWTGVIPKGTVVWMR